MTVASDARYHRPHLIRKVTEPGLIAVWTPPGGSVRFRHWLFASETWFPPGVGAGFISGSPAGGGSRKTKPLGRHALIATLCWHAVV